MSVLDQRVRRISEELTKVLSDLVSREEGIPRPIIGLNHAMPFLLPVHQRAVSRLRALAREYQDEFEPASLTFIVHPYQNAADKRLIGMAHPYTELTRGEEVGRLEDGSAVVLVTLAAKDVPPHWRSERPLDLYIHAQSKNKRYGEALGSAPRINLRVPRFAIPGKETGV